MSNAGQIHIHDWENNIYLYTHWGAEHLIRDVYQGILNSRDRWCDFPYFTRTMFDYMRQVDDFRKDSSYGISCNPSSEAWREVDIDMDRLVITIFNYNESVSERWMGSFEKFMTINWRK